ncbi:MAG: hypothetical protein ACI4R9_08310 [Kiritimatiellia bacterium]
MNGLIVTNTAPNGALTITRRNADGDTLSITGDGVTPEFYSRGVLADGTRWTKTVQGETADSPRFTKCCENLLGEAIREKRSGFRGAILASVNTYDSYGRLVSTASDGEPVTEYAYDVLGERVSSTTSVGADVPGGTIEWRKTESHSNFAPIVSCVWTIQTNITSCSDATIAPLVTSQATQLTGLTSANPSRSRAIDIRGNVTEFWTEFVNGITIAKRHVPESANIASTHSRYGMQIETISHSSVINMVCYDALGRSVSTIDGRGDITRTRHGALGRRTASVDADGNHTVYAYNGFGELVAITNAMGEVITYGYDLRGQKTYEGGATYPVRYAYDLFGNKVSMTTYRAEDAQGGGGCHAVALRRILELGDQQGLCRWPRSRIRPRCTRASY